MAGAIQSGSAMPINIRKGIRASTEHCVFWRCKEWGADDEVRELCFSVASNVHGCFFKCAQCPELMRHAEQKSATLMCSLNRNIAFDFGRSYLPLGSILPAFKFIFH